MLEGWQRAGRFVRTARTRAGLKPRDFQRATGVSPRTLWALEMGERDTFSDETLAAVEGELGWPDGEIRHLAEGGRPRRSQYPPDLQEIIRMWPKLTPDVRATLVELAHRSASRRG